MFDEFDDSMNGHYTRITLNSVDDSGPQQLVAATGISGQVIGEAVRLQHFGATSVPPAGAEGLALLGGGRFDKAFLLGFEHPDKRPRNLPGGAKAIYDASGNIIKLVGDTAVFDFSPAGKGWSVTCKGGTVTSDGKDFYVAVASANLYLGGKKGDSFAPVTTTAGPSRNVLAAI